MAKSRLQDGRETVVGRTALTPLPRPSRTRGDPVPPAVWRAQPNATLTAEQRCTQAHAYGPTPVLTDGMAVTVSQLKADLPWLHTGNNHVLEGPGRTVRGSDVCGALRTPLAATLQLGALPSARGGHPFPGHQRRGRGHLAGGGHPHSQRHRRRSPLEPNHRFLAPDFSTHGLSGQQGSGPGAWGRGSGPPAAAPPQTERASEESTPLVMPRREATDGGLTTTGKICGPGCLTFSQDESIGWSLKQGFYISGLCVFESQRLMSGRSLIWPVALTRGRPTVCPSRSAALLRDTPSLCGFAAACWETRHRGKPWRLRERDPRAGKRPLPRTGQSWQRLSVTLGELVGSDPRSQPRVADTSTRFLSAWGLPTPAPLPAAGPKLETGPFSS